MHIESKVIHNEIKIIYETTTVASPWKGKTFYVCNFIHLTGWKCHMWSSRNEDYYNSFAYYLILLFLLSSIGYPVVTLGFGFKSYVSYRLRLRKQREVQKENDFYMQLLQQALPQEVLTNSLNTVPDKSKGKNSQGRICHWNNIKEFQGNEYDITFTSMETQVA